MNLVINFHKRKLMRTKVNKMNKIVFSKLWEHDAYCKIGNVHLQNKRFRGSTWIENGAIGKEAFKDWKTLLASTPQENYWSFLVNQIRGVTMIVGNEMSIKVGKFFLKIIHFEQNLVTQSIIMVRTLQGSMWMPFLEITWPKTFHFKLMKFTLLQFGVRSNLL